MEQGMTVERLRAKYQNDPAFHALVDTLCKALTDNTLTVVDLDNALTLGTRMYEQKVMDNRCDEYLKWKGMQDETSKYSPGW
jgi:hypothetical protein